MGAEAPIDGREIVEVVAFDREAADQHEAAPVAHLAVDGGDVGGDGVEGKRRAADIVDREARAPHADQGRVEGVAVAAGEIEGVGVLAREVGGLPGAGMVDGPVVDPPHCTSSPAPPPA